MSEFDYGETEGDIAEYRNAISPICSECGSPLDDEKEIADGVCCVCWEWIHR